MSEGRRIAALMIAVTGLGAAAFGVVRGLSATGPAHGVRMQVSIAPPLDATVVERADRVASERVDEKGMEVRVIPAGEGLVIELGEADPAIVADIAALLERTAKLEVHAVDAASPWLAKVATAAAADPTAAGAGVRVDAGVLVADARDESMSIADATAIGCAGRDHDGRRTCAVRGDRVLARYIEALAAREPSLAPPADRVLAYGRNAPRGAGTTARPYVLERDSLVDPRAVHQVEVASRGVAIEVGDASRIKPGVPLAFLLDGRVSALATPDATSATQLHVVTPGATDEDAFRAASELVLLIDAGVAHPMHVVHTDAFTRATGFLPRAWPFFATCVVFLLVAAALGLRGGRAKPAA